MILDVSQLCGDDIISRDAGKKIRELILSAWDEASIELHFNGRTVGSVSFFDEAIGLLVKKGGKSIGAMKNKLKFPDLKPEDRALLNYVVLTRVKEARSQKGSRT